MDTNGDGKIAKVEFGKAVRRLNLEPSPSRAEIDSLFDECDLDGSGTVEYKELQRLVRRRAPTSSEPSALRTSMPASTISCESDSQSCHKLHVTRYEL